MCYKTGHFYLLLTRFKDIVAAVSTVSVFRFSGFQVFRFSGFQVFRFSGFQVLIGSKGWNG